MDENHAEPRGYLAGTQTPDNVVHILSSRLHYRFNLAWLENKIKKFVFAVLFQLLQLYYKCNYN